MHETRLTCVLALIGAGPRALSDVFVFVGVMRTLLAIQRQGPRETRISIRTPQCASGAPRDLGAGHAGAAAAAA
ncbi:hypothetical protein BC834DRAFT_907052 [Gloeopeniophorella convolvens]|nr:hypothetical protein BC834DRAFT_907052 [Gloeopeniophorella convolvens]